MSKVEHRIPDRPLSDYLVLSRHVIEEIPTARHYAAFVLVYSLALTYGSWLPFQFSRHNTREAIALFRRVLAQPIQWSTSSDFMINGLLWVPLAFAAMGLLCVDRSSRWSLSACIPVLIGCAGLSFLVEFGQTWIPQRSESQNDIAAQVVGAVTGCLLWISAGDRLNQWVRDALNEDGGTPRLRRLLQIFCVGFVLYAVMPLDALTSLTEWRARFISGYCNALPFQGLHFDASSCVLIIKKAAYWIPIGLLFGLSTDAAGTSRASRWSAVLRGACLLAATEAAQSWIRSRDANINDVIFGLVGISLGAIGGPQLPWKQSFRFLGHKRPMWFRAAAACVAFGFSAFLFGLFWYPFHRVHDPNVLAERWRSFFALPFSRLWSGSEFNALGQIILKTGIFAILGSFVALSFPSPADEPGEHFRRRWSVISLVGLMAGVMEAGQIFFSSRYPDAFDIVLACLGAMTGIWFIEYLSEPLDPQPGIHPRFQGVPYRRHDH